MSTNKERLDKLQLDLFLHMDELDRLTAMQATAVKNHIYQYNTSNGSTKLIIDINYINYKIATCNAEIRTAAISIELVSNIPIYRVAKHFNCSVQHLLEVLDSMGLRLPLLLNKPASEMEHIMVHDFKQYDVFTAVDVENTLKYLRNKLAITQGEMAEQLAITKTEYANMEKEYTIPDFIALRCRLAEIAKILKVTPETIVTRHIACIK